MDLELVFKICNLIVLPGWILLFFFPKWKYTKKIIYSYLIPFILGIIYICIIVLNSRNENSGSFTSLAGISALFQNPLTLLAGWVHYLAFDLFTGCWEVKDADKNNISHIIVFPCLFATLMAGPLGLVLYLLVRMFLKKKIFFED